MQTLESLLGTFVERHPEEAAQAFEDLELSESIGLIERLAAPVGAQLLERTSPHLAARMLEGLAPQSRANLLAEMTPRAGAALLEHLDKEACEEVLAQLPEETARPLRDALRYPEDTAGGMMEPRVASLSVDLSVQQTISMLRKTPREVLHYLYVTNRRGQLVGVLNMRDLLLASPDERIEPLVKRDILKIPATTDREEVVRLMRERKFLALPVVDEEEKLVGVVKHDEALVAGQEEAFEDIQIMVGAGGDESALSPVGTVVKRRLPWLYVNLITAFIAAAVVGLFEGIIEQVTALAVLLPVVAGQGGNSGSQSLAIVMRGLALREIVPGTARRLLIKEFLAGSINGLAVAVVTAAAVMIWAPLDSWNQILALAMVIGVSMVITVTLAVLAGSGIPLLLRKLGRDPAQSATIFLTTVTDVVGFASFLGLAVLFSALLL